MPLPIFQPHSASHLLLHTPQAKMTTWTLGYSTDNLMDYIELTKVTDRPNGATHSTARATHSTGHRSLSEGLSAAILPRTKCSRRSSRPYSTHIRDLTAPASPSLRNSPTGGVQLARSSSCGRGAPARLAANHERVDPTCWVDRVRRLAGQVCSAWDESYWVGVARTPARRLVLNLKMRARRRAWSGYPSRPTRFRDGSGAR